MYPDSPALSVPWPSEAIAPAPSAEQGRRAPILVCRLPRAGRKFVSPVTFPFLASLTLSGSVQREIRVPQRVGWRGNTETRMEHRSCLRDDSKRVGQEGDKRGSDSLLSGCLEYKVTVFLPQPSPRENVKTRTLFSLSPCLTKVPGPRSS